MNEARGRSTRGARDAGEVARLEPTQLATDRRGHRRPRPTGSPTYVCTRLLFQPPDRLIAVMNYDPADSPSIAIWGFHLY